MWRCLVLCLIMAIHAEGHVVTQIFGEWKQSEPWQIEVLFDAGYAVPELRDDINSPAPSREWLVEQGEAGWAPLRREAERYFRECLQVKSGGKDARWTIEFIDFRNTPPDFPELLNDGAYFRMKILGVEPLEPGATIHWAAGTRPSFVIKLPGENTGYLTLAPSENLPLPVDGHAAQMGRPAWMEAFRQGFLHVLPTGLDHILFVLGLFLYRRAWKPLVAQSLAFTLAHTLTIGLASAGIIRISGTWVDPLIALSLVVVALENLKADRSRNGKVRLAIVFGFGLVHGLGFAGTLSAWIKPGDGFLPALVSANLGVEAAQVCLLAAAWIVTLPLVSAAYYPRLRVVACLGIATAGMVLALQRMGWLGS